MNNYTQMFVELLDLMELTLEKDDDGYVVFDNQVGSYRHDKAVYSNASHIFDDTEAFINDYIVRALEDTEKDLIGTEYDYRDLQDYVNYLKNTEVYREAKWDVDVLDMICNHSDEINLNEAYNQIRK